VTEKMTVHHTSSTNRLVWVEWINAILLVSPCFGDRRGFATAAAPRHRLRRGCGKPRLRSALLLQHRALSKIAMQNAPTLLVSTVDRIAAQGEKGIVHSESKYQSYSSIGKKLLPSQSSKSYTPVPLPAPAAPASLAQANAQANIDVSWVNAIPNNVQYQSIATDLQSCVKSSS